MDSNIKVLEKHILELGNLVQKAISNSIQCLVSRDELLARSVVNDDKTIDLLEVEVQQECLDLLEEFRPTGTELRFIVAVLKINDSLERIGDLAENVAVTVIEVGNWERFQQVPGLSTLAQKAQTMVNDSLIALINRDPQLAREVIRFDDQVDDAQDRIRKSIEIELDRIPEYASPLMLLENVTRQFERVGDIACNIAEEVIFLVEGNIVRHMD